MSLKRGFTNTRLGGSKSGLIMPEGLKSEERLARFRAFGRQLGPLLRSRVYIPGAELGTSHEDRLVFLRAAGARLPVGKHGEPTHFFKDDAGGEVKS